MNKEINYITYQTFPSNKANTFQTMDNIKYFEKMDIKSSSHFPLGKKVVHQTKIYLKNFIPYQTS